MYSKLWLDLISPQTFPACQGAQRDRAIAHSNETPERLGKLHTSTVAEQRVGDTTSVSTANALLLPWNGVAQRRLQPSRRTHVGFSSELRRVACISTSKKCRCRWRQSQQRSDTQTRQSRRWWVRQQVLSVANALLCAWNVPTTIGDEKATSRKKGKVHFPVSARRRTPEAPWNRVAQWRPQPVTGGRGKSDGKTAKCRGTTPEDVSHAPISILATRQSRIELATTAGISTPATASSDAAKKRNVSARWTRLGQG